MPKPTSNTVPNFLIVFGLMMIVTVWFVKASLLVGGVRAQAVVEMITCCSRSTEGVQLRIDTGDPKRPMRLGTSAHQGEYHKGDVVNVIYDPERPDGAMIFRGEPSWVSTIVLFGIGILVVALGVWLRWPSGEPSPQQP